MATTLIRTAECSRTRLEGGRGHVAQVLNQGLCGAQNVTGLFRWLDPGDRFDAEPLADTHQLIYLMEGNGAVELRGNSYEITPGAGVYLGPAETAGVSQRGETPAKLLHLVVPIKR